MSNEPPKTAQELLAEVAATPVAALDEFYERTMRADPVLVTREEKLRMIAVERQRRAQFIRGKEDKNAKEVATEEAAADGGVVNNSP